MDQIKYLSTQKFTRSMITPEIAAFVVKEYLLPMFESDGKRLISKRSTASKSKSPQHQREPRADTILTNSEVLSQSNLDQVMSKDYTNVDLSATGLSQNIGRSQLGQNKTVYSELKLSEILLADIDTFKAEVMRLKELNQRDQDEIAILSKEVKE